ncbi:ATP-binding protein [Pedobacter sp. AW31-3R]|uniref:ATP-binding protein n=1 Tax=Pedobacter sp. AW31-3R TaxID=3445781 RepID=UPI003FA0C0FF
MRIYPLKFNLFEKIFCCFLLTNIILNTLIYAQHAPVNNTEAHRKLANKIGRIKDDSRADAYADSLTRIAKAAADQEWEAQILLAKSYKAYKSGDQHKAEQFAREAMASVKESDSLTYVKAPLMIAFMLNRQGKDGQALKFAFQTLRKADEKAWTKLGIACRNCVADIYRSRHDTDKALPYALQASKDALQLKDTAAYIYSLSTLSNIYSTQARNSPERLLKASAYAEEILREPLLSSLSNFDKASYSSNLGRLYEMMGKFKEAEHMLRQSIVISRKEGFTDLEKHALNELMTTKSSQGLYREAIQYGEEAIALLSDGKSNQVVQRNIYERLAEATVAIKDYKQAYQYTIKARAINDSLMTLEKTQVSAEMDEAYRADKRITEANSAAKLMEQQRNFIIVLAVIAVAALFGLYRWIIFRRNKKAELLIAQHEQLAKLDEMKTRFFSNISHELRTPLTLIVGPIDQLHQQKIQPLSTTMQEKYIEMVWANSKKLLNMFNELLDLSKIEAGSLPVQLRAMAVEPLMHLLYQGFTSSAEYKKISFHLSCSIGPDITAEIDKDKLEKIINNLIGNALKFTPAQGRVDMLVSAKPSGMEIIVKDTGAGIPEDSLKHIFERYYQVSRVGQTAEGGTGIGLAISKEYTEMLGGNITVQSSAGLGTSFNVFIPMVFHTLVIARPDPLLAEDGQTSAVDPGNYTHEGFILLVEDQQEMAEYISSVLAPFYRIETAINGFDALEKLGTYAELPALIISDVMMPGMNGFELLSRLKAHEVYFRIPVVMLTALGDMDNRLTALNIGVDDYLSKPFISTELIARSSNLIQHSRNRFLHPGERAFAAALPVNDTEEEGHVSISPADLLWLNKLENLIRNSNGKFDLELSSVSYHMAISERQLFRTVKSITGLTPNKYIRTIRLQIAREAIESGKYRTVAEIANVAGFDTPSYFSKLFKESYGRDVTDLL